MIELYELRQFAAFGEAGTLSGAAETLHLSQPALSRNMKKIEDDFGITLFERKKNKLSRFEELIPEDEEEAEEPNDDGNDPSDRGNGSAAD